MRAVILSLAIIFQVSYVMASAFPTSISRDPMKISDPSEKLTVGALYEDIKMGIDLDNGPDAVLNAKSAGIYIGYDLIPGVTLFTTLGASEIDSEGDSDTSGKFKISGGVNAYLLEADVLEPEYMSGRFTIKANFEVSHYDSGGDVGDVSWTDATLAVPFGYEIFDNYPESPKGINTSIALYVGPALSYVSGTWDSDVGDMDFERTEILGVIGGVDFFLSPTVSLGAEFSYFDETTVGGSIRFHL